MKFWKSQIFILLKRDLLSYVHSPLFYLFFIFFWSSIFFLSFNLPPFWSSGRDITPFFNWLKLTLVVYLPALTMDMWIKEKEQGSFEILSTLPLPTESLVIGKYLASVTLSLIFGFLTLGIPLVAIYATGHDRMLILMGYIGAFFLSACYIAISSYCSWFFKKESSAFFVSTSVCFFFHMLGYEPIMKYLGEMKLFFSQLSVSWHFESFYRGILDSRSLIYFSSLISFVLYAQKRSIEKFRQNKTGRFQFGEGNSFRTVLWFMVFILVNTISSVYYIRIDLSERQTLKITQTTRQMIKNLSAPLTIEAFFSADVPDFFVRKAKDVKDILKEYALASDGKIKLIFNAPDTDDSILTRIDALSVPHAKIIQTSEDKKLVNYIYFSVVLHYKSKVKIINNTTEASDMEAQLTLAIHEMSGNSNLPKIALASNSGNLYFDSINNKEQTNSELNFLFSMKQLKEKIIQSYSNVKEVNLLFDKIPDGFSTLLVIGPEQLAEVEKFKIDQFIMSGGNIIFAVNDLKINFINQLAVRGEGSVHHFLRHYGFNIKPNLVLEPFAHLPIQSKVKNGESTEIPYPAWVMVQKEGLSKEHFITKNLSGLFMPYVSQIEVTPQQVKNHINYQTLIRSSLDAKVISGKISTNPFVLNQILSQHIKEEGSNQQQAINLAIYAEGKFSSFYKGKRIPQGLNNVGSLIEEAHKMAKIFVLPTSYMFIDTALEGSRQKNNDLASNLYFLLSSIDFMNGQKHLIELREKKIIFRQYRNIKQERKKLILILCFALPFVIILLGMFSSFIWGKLKKRRPAFSSFS